MRLIAKDIKIRPCN